MKRCRRCWVEVKLPGRVRPVWMLKPIKTPCPKCGRRPESEGQE